MKAAVCCPGHSLIKKYPGDYGYAAVWAINTAMLLIPCDWLSAGDPVLFKKNHWGDKRPRIGVLTMMDTVEQVKGLDGWGGIEFTGWERLRFYAAHNLRRPVSWSVQVALLHACELGATQIDLFGCDGIHGPGGPDITGYPGDFRCNERWQREEAELIITIQLLAEQGTVVRRYLP
jgi:hypothetical protein